MRSKMYLKQGLWVGVLVLVAVLSACLAPEDLDYTPTAPPPTETPASAAADSAPATEEASSANQEVVEQILAAMPATINTSNLQWRQDTSTPPNIVEREGGVTGRISLNEPGGGYSELTFGVFDTPEAARSYYDQVRGQLRTLEHAVEKDEFFTPNAFGGGTYGSDAIFVIDNLFIRISVPRFPSPAGDPLVPYSRALFRILSDAGFVASE